MTQDIFAFIKEQEAEYDKEYEVMANWVWGMKEHIRTTILLKHGLFKESTNDLKYKQPNKNIVYPLLNLRYRAEDIDMKEVLLYVDDPSSYHLSFLVKKYHDEVYVPEHDLDTFFDETKEEKIDYGATLVRKGPRGPVLEPLDSIAFCDQTDILSGPIGFKLFFSPDELYEMGKFGWGDTKNGADITLDELVALAEEAKQQDAVDGKRTETPGKYIEIYRVHGAFPKSWLTDKDTVSNEERYVRQMHIVGLYKNKDGASVGVTLYKKREYENPFKIHLSGKKIKNRALAYGGVEELIDPQVWTNYSEIRKKDLLDAVSKIVRWTDDESLAARNKLNDLENNEMLVVQKGSQVGILNSSAPNVQLFNEWIKEWDVTSQSTSGATDALLGKSPTAGSPFALQSLVVQQGQGLHEYRRGKFATFLAEIYNDWIIPDIQKSLSSGTKFLATLSPDEMEYVTDCLVRSEANKLILEKVLAGEEVDPEMVETFKQQVRDDFSRGGNKKFIEILKGEFDQKPLRVKVNVAGKQKDMAAIVEKLSNIFRQVFSNPAILQDPKAAKVFNKIIEFSGMEPIDFGYVSTNQPTEALPALPQANPVPA